MADNCFYDEAKKQDALLLIAHFDELLTDNRKMMNALTIRLWCNWCAGGKNDNPKKKYYSLLINRYKGAKEQFPKWHAITQCKSRLNGCDIMELQRDFNAKADSIIEKYRSLSDKQVV